MLRLWVRVQMWTRVGVLVASAWQVLLLWALGVQLPLWRLMWLVGLLLALLLWMVTGRVLVAVAWQAG